MDFDNDLESSWPFDHVSCLSNPMSPFLLSNISEQPFSPLWAFSDVEDDKHVSITASGFSSLIAIYPYFVTVCFGLNFVVKLGFFSFLYISSFGFILRSVISQLIIFNTSLLPTCFCFCLCWHEFLPFLNAHLTVTWIAAASFNWLGNLRGYRIIFFFNIFLYGMFFIYFIA